jgi:DNA-directed RNA polymerase specialized sigma subunit
MEEKFSIGAYMTKLEEKLKGRIAERQAIIALLSNPNLSYEEIGRRMGITKSRVYQIRREEGLPRKIALYTRPKATTTEGVN